MRLMSAMLLPLVLSACKPGDDDGSWSYVMSHPESRSREFQTENMICVVWVPRVGDTALSCAKK
jgi:hypothetical protein